jgi:hypothetical protein
MQNLDNTNAFFSIAGTPGLSEDIYMLCLQCLSELASCRISLFEDFNARKGFVHNFSSNLNELMKVQSEHFCSSRLVCRNYIKVFYKLEMNFQIRSFGVKETNDLSILQTYLENLSDLTLLLIKSGQSYLREAAIPLLCAWTRINLEMKSQDVGVESVIKGKIEEIVAHHIEQNISDLSPQNDEEDEEHFNETELNTLTQRFDAMARLCNIHIQTAFDRIDQGLRYLMEQYDGALKKQDTETLDIIEMRFGWTLRLVTSLINLGYSPKKADPNNPPEGPQEYDICIKIIEVIKLNVDINDDRKMDETMELAILSFISTLRSNVLADPRVVSKVVDNDDETGIHRADSYITIANSLTANDLLGIVEIFFKKMILNFFSDSIPVIEQSLELLKTFVGSPGTQKFLLKLDTTQELLENHFTKFEFLNTEETYDYLSRFYKEMTVFWEINDSLKYHSDQSFDKSGKILESYWF